MHERDRGRQQLVEAELDDAVRLPAADFHDGPRPRDPAGDRCGEFPRRGRVAKFVDELHGMCGGGAGRVSTPAAGAAAKGGGAG